jgi:hypothetical protein
MALPQNLLTDVKNYLDITWNDDALDLKIEGIINRGMKYIDTMSGNNEDYLLEEKPRELLFDYCRYARSHGLEDFKNNFKHELLSLQINRKVERYNAEENANL